MTSDEMNFSEQGVTPFLNTKGTKKFWKSLNQNQLTRNRKYISDRMPKNDELQTKRTKTTWNTYEDSDEGKLGLSRPNL